METGGMGESFIALTGSEYAIDLIGWTRKTLHAGVNGEYWPGATQSHGAIFTPDSGPHALGEIIIGGKIEVWSERQTLFAGPLEMLSLNRLGNAKDAKSLDQIGNCRRDSLRAESVGVGLDDRHHRNAGHGSNLLDVSADSTQVDADGYMRAERHATIQLAESIAVQFFVTLSRKETVSAYTLSISLAETRTLP